MKNEKEIEISFKFNEEGMERINKYAPIFGGVNEMIAMLSFFYLENGNPDFVHCPKCGLPIAFIPNLPLEGDACFECKCGHKFNQEI